MIDVHKLSVFRAVVASGSVHAAADNLGFAPSTVSQHIAALQRETKLVLFEKTGRGITATAAGRHLAAMCAPLMSEVSRVEMEIAALQEGQRNSLTVATFASAARELLPPVLRAVADEFSGLRVDVFLTDQGVPLPIRPDITLVSSADTEPVQAQSEIQYVTLGREIFSVVLPADHPLCGRDKVAMAELAEEQWIRNCVSDDVCSTVVDQACAAAGFTPRYVAHTSDHITAISFVEAGLGVTVVPELALDLLPKDVKYVPLVQPTPIRRIVAEVQEYVMASEMGTRILELLTYQATRNVGLVRPPEMVD